ncbi:hypothetical protein NL676_004730 [Syzygium grande]|nr:hypothetical protein NL676_004730 [Syzygium grande]
MDIKSVVPNERTSDHRRVFLCQGHQTFLANFQESGLESRAELLGEKILSLVSLPGRGLKVVRATTTRFNPDKDNGDDLTHFNKRLNARTSKWQLGMREYNLKSALDHQTSGDGLIARSADSLDAASNASANSDRGSDSFSHHLTDDYQRENHEAFCFPFFKEFS